MFKRETQSKKCTVSCEYLYICAHGTLLLCTGQGAALEAHDAEAVVLPKADPSCSHPSLVHHHLVNFMELSRKPDKVSTFQILQDEDLRWFL